jgi:acyl-coenzyme A thioesterase PaaI-like protein
MDIIIISADFNEKEKLIFRFSGGILTASGYGIRGCCFFESSGFREKSTHGERMKPVRIIAKQPNSKMCFVCGLENRFGLRSRFFELETGELLGLFRPADEHQGYPGRLHGGLAATILDETIGRCIMISQSDSIWGVTVEFSMRLRKPIPLDQEVRVVGRVLKDGKRIFEGSGEILLPGGIVAVEARGKYLKMDISKIADFDVDEQQWRVRSSDDDPVSIEL